jgi:hypothetical protein
MQYILLVILYIFNSALYSYKNQSFKKQITMELRLTHASHHEQIGSRINFPNKKLLGWRTVCRVTNTQTGNNGWRQAGSIGGRASVV